jgi:hypothetical protein
VLQLPEVAAALLQPAAVAVVAGQLTFLWVGSQPTPYKQPIGLRNISSVVLFYF